MNLPNKLTILRIILVPFFMLFIMLPEMTQVNSFVCDFIAAAIFGIAAYTDMLDGKIARKNNIVTDFGKFMDPIADKIMTFGAFIAILGCTRFDVLSGILVWVITAVLLREFAVTSIRMIAQSKENVVIAASFAGKVKTVSQIVSILVILLEPYLFFWDVFAKYRPLSFISIIVMLIFTIYSGANYIKAYWKFLDTQK